MESNQYGFYKNGIYHLNIESFNKGILEYLNHHNIKTEEDSDLKLNKKGLQKEIIQFLKERFDLQPTTPLGNHISKNSIKLFFKDKVLNNYSSNRKGERMVTVFDSNGIKLSNTHLSKAIKIINNGNGTWVEKNSILKLNNTISTKLMLSDTIFNKIYKLQNKCCNVCNRELTAMEGELHHKYIPQTLKRINSRWNVEILCKKCHTNKHDKVSLVNILISIVKILNK